MGILLVTLSCEKENSSNNFPKMGDYRLSKLLHYSSSTSTTPSRGVEYSYDGNGNLIKESFYDYLPSTVLWTYKTYEYSGNKKIKQKIYDGVVGNLTLGLYIDYYYTDDKLIKEETYRSSGSIANSMNYEYE
jgi:hypothetical protein